MTADIEANNHNHNHGEVRESEEVVVLAANNGGEQCCGPDDAVDVLSEINGNKDDVDGSYVFVTSHDDGDDLAGSDLNNANDNKPSVEEGPAVSQFQAEEKGNGDRETEALGSPVDELNSRSSPEVDDDWMEGGGGGGGEIQELDIGAKNSDELGLVEGVEKDKESEIGVDNEDNSINNNINNNVPSDNTDQGLEWAEESSNEIPKRGSGDDQEQEDPSTVSCLECKIKVDMVIEEIPICGDFGNGFPDGSKEVSVEESKQHNLEPQSTSNSLSDNILETEAANRPLSEQQNGESLPADLAVKSLSETAVVTEQHASPAALDNEKPLCLSEESPVDGFRGDDDGEVLGEHGLETCLGTGADEALEGEVATGPLLEQNGEDLPPGLAQESLSDAAVVIEPNGSSEIAQGLTYPLVCSNVALESGQCLPAVPVNGIIRSLDVEDVRPENDTGELNQESIESLDDSCPIKNDPKSNGPANGVMSEPESSSASNGGEELVSTDAFNVESTLSKTSPECGANQCIISEVASVEQGSEVDDGIAPRDKDRGIAADVDVDVDFVHVESDVKSESQEPEDIEGKQMDEASTSSQENSGQTVDNDGNQKDEEASTTLPEGQNAGIEEVKRQFYFLIRSPRYDDENLREQIKRAKLQVEEKTKIRGAIHAKVQTQRAIVKEYADKVQASLTEERAARDLFKSKRQEFDSVQSVIIKVKNAESVEDIHAKIRSMEHMIEHETLPLKEEKQLIREIKQLKQQREQISSNMGKQNEVQQALDQKDQIEERSKFLRKELDLLREKLSKAEEATQTAKKKSNVENGKLNELLYQFRDADDIRQEAYAHFRSLKEQYSVKIELFNGFKNAAIEAQKLALSKDKEQLQRNCFDQVEKFMELWNRDDDFRKDYIRNNTRSTLWRLGTFDGRSLGPDEEPPVIPDFAVNSRVTKQNSVPLTKIPEQEKQEVLEKVEKLDDKSGAKVVERENQTVKTTKKPAKPAISSGTSPVTNSDKDERKAEREEEEPRRSKEEEELARKAEELRKEEEAARLKQQRNLEEKAKAKEAMERKKRITEKAQARAAIRAQKEAEQKEKEREKRARKKERKKANKIDPITEDEGGECAQTPSSEVDASTGAQPEPKKPPATMLKRPQKPQLFTKQSRARSVAVPPPLLRSRGKKRMQTWMWVVLAFTIVLALLFFWSTSIHWFGF